MRYHRTPSFATLLFTFFFVAAVAAPQGRGQASSPPNVEIPGTQVLKIRSAITGEDYNLLVNIPRNYGDTTRSFPVLYLLDGQWDFPLVNAVFGEQYYDGFVPEILTVGIAWGGKNPNYDSLRMRDLTPTTIKPVPSSGNAPMFLKFIKKELIPFVESQYRTVKDDRTLMGSSLGGLFTLYALFHETGVFSRYVLTSPSLGWDNDIVSTYEREYAAKNSRLPVRLFMAISELEGGMPGFQKFVDQLKARKYEGLDFHSKVLEGMGHSGSKAEGYSRGLQAVFARPLLAVDPAVLDRYVGSYQLSPSLTVRILKENGSLVLVMPDSTKITLYAESEKDFYVKGMYLFLKFDKKNTGNVSGVQVEQFQGQAYLKRVE